MGGRGGGVKLGARVGNSSPYRLTVLAVAECRDISVYLLWERRRKSVKRRNKNSWV